MQRQNIGNQLTSFFKSGSLLSIIVIVNVAVWLLMAFFPLVDYLYCLPSGAAKREWYGWLALSSEWGDLLRRPWTLLTYMFMHSGFWHLFFNMVMLYFGGMMCCRYMGTRKFGWIYFICGIAGALLYLAVYNLFPVGRVQTANLVGASAAVLGVFIAVAVYAPNQEVSFWLIRTFSFKIKWVAVAFVVIDLLSIPSANAGGHIAHLGGALFGWLYVVAMRWQASRPVRRQRPRRKLFRRKTDKRKQTTGRPVSDEEYNRRRSEDQKRVDAILDKISKSGYDGLSKSEKEFLFKHSGR